VWEEKLSSIIISTLLESSDGTIWAGALTRGGLLRYDGETWNHEAALHRLTIRTLMESSDGDIWVGVGDIFGGLFRHDGEEWSQEEALSGIEIRSLLESSDGVIWAGTRNDGLFSYDGVVWRKAPLSKDRVPALLESSDGYIWAGTSGGLFRYNGTTWESQGPRGIYILSLLESSDGRIWAGTYQKGVHIYDGVEWYNLTIVDGLPANTVDTILEDRDGNLWFGTRANGIRVYNPSDNAPQIKLITPKEQPIRIGSVPITIEWFAGDIETENHRLTYEYKIDESAWTPTESTTITLTDLKVGERVFSVRAIDGDFNVSEPATLIITIDTAQPEIRIDTPVQGAIVGHIVPIMGRVTDTDFDEFRVEYAPGETPSDSDFKTIRQSNLPVESGELAQWNTESLAEMRYTIRVSAIDQLKNTAVNPITVTLDKQPPTATLIAPMDGARLIKQTKIKAVVSDQHLNAYVLEYLVRNLTGWEQIYQRTGLFQAQETEVQIERDWEVPTISNTNSRTIDLRLIAIDAAGNRKEDMFSVEVPQALEKDRGGTVNSVGGGCNLTIPPRSLPADTIIAINPVPVDEIQPPPDLVYSLNLAYDIKPDNLKLNSIKPATLQIKHNGHSTQDRHRLAIFHWQPFLQRWEFLGGTVNQNEVTLGITQFGRYALMEVEKSATIAPRDSLFTCQPRVFSPEQDTATISFSLTAEIPVTLKVYNIDGRLQRILLSGESMPIGHHAVLWDRKDKYGKDVPSGLYLIALQMGKKKVKTKAVVVQNR
jgi:hypothetical protein